MDDTLKDIIGWFFKGCATVSMFTTIGFAIDRYWALTQLMNYSDKKSRRYTKILIAVYWILGYFCSSMSYVEDGKKSYLWISLILFTTSLVMFVTINSIVYIKMRSLWIMKNHEENHEENGIRNVDDDRRMKQEMKITQTFRIIFFVYFVLFCPYFITKYLAKIFNFKTIFGLNIKAIRTSCRNLMLLNSCVNSIIYAYRVKTIKSDIRKLFGITKRTVNQEHNQKNLSSGCTESKTEESKECVTNV